MRFNIEQSIRNIGDIMRNVINDRSRTKETVSELKKVSWPSFGKTLKQTGMVISVVLIFMLLIIGIDQLLIWLLSLLP